MKDLQTNSDVQQLVHTFYERIQADPILSPAFQDVNWETHLPRMVEFWHTIIFRIPGYKGNPAEVHAKVMQRTAVEPAHFDHWVSLFQNTVDTLFQGPYATFAKKSAAQMARGLVHNLFEGRELFIPDID